MRNPPSNETAFQKTMFTSKENGNVSGKLDYEFVREGSKPIKVIQRTID
jgi:hypothetical protein